MNEKISHAGTSAFTALITHIKTALGGKVDKVDGKGLSTNDYTTAEKTKLAGIAEGANKTTIVDNLTSTAAASALSANQGKVLDGKIAAINTSLAGKGSGDMQKSVYDTNGDGVVDNAAKLGGQAPSYYAKAADVPTKVSKLTNDAGFQTADQVAAAVDAKLSGTYKAGGSLAFAALPTPDEAHLGMVYNVADAFITTDSFLEGAGKSYPAGSNVVIVSNHDSYPITDEYGMMMEKADPTRRIDYNYSINDPGGYVMVCKNDKGYTYKAVTTEVESLFGADFDPNKVPDSMVIGVLTEDIPIIQDNLTVRNYSYDVLGGFVDLSGYVASSDLKELTADEITAIWNSVTA